MVDDKKQRYRGQHWRGNRQYNLAQHTHVPSSVDGCRLLHFTRQAAEEVHHQQNVEHIDCAGKHQCPHGVDHTSVAHNNIAGNQSAVEHHGNDVIPDVILALLELAVFPGERIGGQDGQHKAQGNADAHTFYRHPQREEKRRALRHEVIGFQRKFPGDQKHPSRRNAGGSAE